MSISSTVRPNGPSLSTPSRSLPPPFGLLGRLTFMLERKQQRDALASLTEDKRLLDDIGLTRDQAVYESGKRFWR